MLCMGDIVAAWRGSVMELFISHASVDKSRAVTLAEQLKQAGNTVWVDSDLRAGQAWWDRILQQIRSCDVLVVGVSRAALKSVACQREREYAMRLGKSILPLTFEPVNTIPLPADIASLQAYDYSAPNANSGFMVIGALAALPAARPLPNPLPHPPDMPPPPLANLVALMNQPRLSENDQFAVIGQLEQALGSRTDERERAVAVQLLNQLAERPELLQSVAPQVATLQKRAGQKRVPRRDPGSGQGTRGGWTGQGTRGGQTGQGKTAPNAVSPRWGMAITAAVLTFLPIFLCPIGIVALINASRVGPSLQAGDLATAQRSSSRVRAMFWTAIALWAVIIIIEIIVAAANGSNSNQSYGLTMIHHFSVR